MERSKAKIEGDRVLCADTQRIISETYSYKIILKFKTVCIVYIFLKEECVAEVRKEVRNAIVSLDPKSSFELFRLAAWAMGADSSVRDVTCGFEALLDSPQITNHERKVTKGYNLFLFSAANTHQCRPMPMVFELRRSRRHWVYFPSLSSFYPGSPHGKREAANELDLGQSLHPLIMSVTAILSPPSFLGPISQSSFCVLFPQQAHTYSASADFLPNQEAHCMAGRLCSHSDFGIGGMAGVNLV